MADVKIISVHPAEKTLGALHPEVIERVKRIARFNVLSYRCERKLRSRVNFFFAVKGKMSRSFSLKLAIVRVMAGLLLIGAQFIGFTDMFSPLWFGFITMGVLFVAGFLTRFASVGIVACMAVKFWLAFNPADPELTYFFAVMPYIGFMILGAGHNSLDAILRHRIFRTLSRRRLRRMADIRMSYNAYSMMK